MTEPASGSPLMNELRRLGLFIKNHPFWSVISAIIIGACGNYVYDISPFKAKSEPVITTNNYYPPSSPIIKVEEQPKTSISEDRSKEPISGNSSNEHREIKDEPLVNTSLDFIADKSFSNTSQMEIAVCIIDDHKMEETKLSSDIVKAYRESSKIATNSFFVRTFINDGVFQNAFNGDLNKLKKVQAEKYVDYIILGETQSSYSNGSISANTKVAEVNLNAKIISTRDWSIVNSLNIDERGIGFSDSEAKRTALSHVLSRFLNEVKL